MIHGSPRSPILALPEIFRVTVRQLLGRRRTLLLLLLAALPLLLALVFRLFDRIDVQRYSNAVFDGVLIAIVLPLTAVLFGTGAFGAELDEGTVLYLLAKHLQHVDTVSAKELRTLCSSHGCLSASHFALAYKDRKLFLVNGGVRSAQISLTMPGIAAAKGLAQSMNEAAN